MNLRPAHPGPIGVDADSTTIRAAQFARGRLIACLELDRVNPGAPIEQEDLVRAADVLERHGFEGRAVVLAAPGSALRTRVLELPPRSSNAPLAQLAAMEMGRELRLAPGGYECASWDIPDPARGANVSHVFAAACPHDAINPVLEAFEGAGFDPAAVECRGAAIARVAASDEPGILAFVDLGRDETLLTLTVRGIVVYERAIREVTVAAMEAQAAEHLRLAPEHAAYALRSLGVEGLLDPRSATIARAVIASHAARIVDDLHAAISYGMHQYPDATVGGLRLCGPGATLPGFAEQLQAETGAEVSLARLAGEDTVGPALITACGLARGNPE